MDENTCAICMNPYTAKVRQKVTCQYCPVHSCRGCQQQCLLNTNEDPHCYSCKRGWSSEFIAENFPISFRNQTLRKHRQKILHERETSLLPAMQIYVEALKNRLRAEELQKETRQLLQEKGAEYVMLQRACYEYEGLNYSPLLNKKIQGTLTEVEKPQLREIRKKVLELREKEKEYYTNEYHPAEKAHHTLIREIRRWSRIYLTGEQGEGVQEKRQFLMRCPGEGCRGFLSTAYKCGVCEKSTCADCLEPLLETGTETLPHTCKPENVESAKAIKKETRPCPKCAARIFKIDGCDQMWCTVNGCNTAFSWNSGHIVSGRVHNPHYYEWLRRQGGGEAEREAGDIPCGGIPPAWQFTRKVLDNQYLFNEEKNTLLEIHRNATDFEARLPNYPARPNAMMNKDLNVKYLMNRISEADWQMKLEHAEASFNRKKEIGQVLQTIVTGVADVLQTVIAAFEERSPIEASLCIRDYCLPTLEKLRIYTNESYRKMGKSLHMAVPQINERWMWTGVRAHYKVKNEIVDTAMDEIV